MKGMFVGKLWKCVFFRMWDPNSIIPWIKCSFIKDLWKGKLLVGHRWWLSCTHTSAPLASQRNGNKNKRKTQQRLDAPLLWPNSLPSYLMQSIWSSAPKVRSSICSGNVLVLFLSLFQHKQRRRVDVAHMQWDYSTNWLLGRGRETFLLTASLQMKQGRWITRGESGWHRRMFPFSVNIVFLMRWKRELLRPMLCADPSLSSTTSRATSASSTTELPPIKPIRAWREPPAATEAWWEMGEETWGSERNHREGVGGEIKCLQFTLHDASLGH